MTFKNKTTIILALQMLKKKITGDKALNSMSNHLQKVQWGVSRAQCLSFPLQLQSLPESKQLKHSRVLVRISSFDTWLMSFIDQRRNFNEKLQKLALQALK